MRILVLGAGRVGAAMARDLQADADFEVTVVDRAAEALTPLREEGLGTVRADLADGPTVTRLAGDHDLVVGAVPGFMGFETLARVIEAGTDAVDISFFPEDAFALDAPARERGARVVVDAGVAPGLGNLLLGHHAARMESTESFTCLVGGLPRDRVGPWEYRASFSPADVIEEYTRPARLRRDGLEVVRPALSEVELVELPGVGVVEAFLTDGLRTLLRTADTPTLVEKTLRYPGHADRARLLRDSGFFGTEPIDVPGGRVRPRDVAVRLLEEAWRFRDGEEDLTVMRAEVVGWERGERVRHVWDLLDRFDPRTSTSSMARTTGYACTALVRWLAGGGSRRAGILPPESLGREEGCLRFVRGHLEQRGVTLSHRVRPAGAPPER